VHALGARLTRDPQGVAWSLEQTKRGAEYLLSQWRMLADIVEKTGRLSAPERWFALDLLGVLHSRRCGTTAVPAGNDKLALLDLIICEIVRLQTRKEECLDECDRMERELDSRAWYPCPTKPRALRSGITRELKRLEWALEQVEQVRSLFPGRPGPPKNGR
jgi:hypothetical protein